MSISPLTRFLQKNDNLNVSSKPVPLPKEVWHHILNFITNNQATYQQISTIAAVCPFFLYHCLQNCVGFRARYILSHKINSPPKSNPILLSEKIPYRHQLAVGQDGKKYYFALSHHKSEMHLFVEDFKEGNFSFLDLSLSKLLPKLSSDPFCDFASHWIVSCHPLADGFIVVTAGAISRWTFEKNKASLKHFYPLSPDFCFTKMIISSGFKDNALYLTTRDNDQVSYLKFNFNEPGTNFLPMTFKDEPSSDFYIFSSGNHLFALVSKTQENCFTLIESEEDPSKALVIEKKILLRDSNFFYKISHYYYHTQTAPWLIFLNEYTNRLHVINLETQKLWIQEEIDSRFMPYGKTRTSFFVGNDFLFISCDSGEFKTFFLPTKQDYTAFLTPVLMPYLSTNWRLSSIEFSKDPKKGLILHALLQDSHETEWLHPQELTKVEIPLENYGSE